MTDLLYLQDAYLKITDAKVSSIEQKSNQTAAILDRTIFYPQGGGQLSDKGTIKGTNGTLQIEQVTYNNGQPLHLGKLTGEIKEGDSITLEIDWQHRYLNMQRHTAGHLLDEAVKEFFPDVYGVEGEHGIGKQYYIKFVGQIDESKKEQIEKKLDEIIKANEPIAIRMVTKEQLDAEGIRVPFKLPENKPLRIIQIGQRQPVPDGGTQLKSTGELWPIKLTQFANEDGHTAVHYQVMQPVEEKKAAKSASVSSGTLNLTDFKSHLDTIGQQLTTEEVNEEVRIKYLGKKGLVNNLSQQLKDLSSEDRKQAGQLLNELKRKAEDHFAQLTTDNLQIDTWLDVTMPGAALPLGHLHPVTQAIEEITRIFESIGFTRVRYPEVDWDWYVFESLNFMKDHPARDDWETYWIDAPPHPEKGVMVLSTHTSNGQVREMERVKEPPIRMLNIAKCYRRQQDVTHVNMFHQFEGLVVDKGINIQHLKGTIDYFARKFYGPGTKSRIRPYNFPFTEPSFEVDFSCTNCSGTGKLADGSNCRFCKSGWHEVGGAGMVHPNVLKAGKIDPDVYTGFAFGWGIERTYTLKPGLKLDDIRLIYDNNLDFLKQF